MQRTSTPSRTFPPLARAAAALALAAGALPALADPGWDMAGVRLGMTEAEVKAAFTAYDPKGKITAANNSFNYSDGVASHRTPPFLASMEIRVVRKAMWTPIKVWFSGPQGTPRVIAIARNEGNLENPVTRAQFEQSLQAKYGPPSRPMTNNMSYWEARGKPSCTRTRTQDQVVLGEFPQVTTGHKTIEQAVAQLEAHAANPGQFYGPYPADLRECGAFMFYGSVDPVTLYTAGLYDVGAIVATVRARQAWVDQLRTEAVQKRQAQGQAPRL